MGPESGAKSGRRIAATARTGGGIAVAGPCSAPLARTVERSRAKPVPNLGGRFVRVGALLFAAPRDGPCGRRTARGAVAVAPIYSCNSTHLAAGRPNARTFIVGPEDGAKSGRQPSDRLRRVHCRRPNWCRTDPATPYSTDWRARPRRPRAESERSSDSGGVIGVACDYPT